MSVNECQDVQISFSSSVVATNEGRRYSAIFAVVVVVVVVEAKYRSRLNRIYPPTFSHTTFKSPGRFLVFIKPVLFSFWNSISI